MIALTKVRLDDILFGGREQGASDIHLSAGVAPIFRIDGKLNRSDTTALSAEELSNMAAGFLDEKQLRDLAHHGDVTVAFDNEDTGAIRIHLYRSKSQISMAIRLLSRSIPKLDELGLPSIVQGLTQCARGLILFTGPTGCGKSTALAAFIQHLADVGLKKIISIEDPIEYKHKNVLGLISQREIESDVASFSDAIRGALRSDPDVILVGELRETLAMNAALTAAETGHLVLATLHTGDAPQTIERIIGSFEGSTQSEVRIRLAHVLKAVICMRLVPRASGSGRTVAAEVLLCTDAVRNVIREARIHQLRNLIATGGGIGMQTLEADLASLVEHGRITLQASRDVL